MCSQCDTDYINTMEANFKADAGISEPSPKSFTIRRIIHLYHEGFTAAQISEFFKVWYTRPAELNRVSLAKVETFIELFA